MGLIGVGSGIYFWNKSKREQDAQSSAERLQGDIYTQQAALIRNAIAGAGTDEEALFKVAPQITNWSLVAKAYQTLTQGGNIEQDLSADLSADEYKYFMSLLAVKGRVPVTNKGLIKPVSVGISANKIIKFKPNGDQRAGGKICFYTSVENYAKAKPFWCTDPTKVIRPANRNVKFIESVQFQWKTESKQGYSVTPFGTSNQGKSDMLLGPITYLFLVELVDFPPYTGKRYYVPFYQFENNGK
jgi:hypothetical protein